MTEKALSDLEESLPPFTYKFLLSYGFGVSASFLTGERRTWRALVGRRPELVGNSPKHIGKSAETVGKCSERIGKQSHRQAAGHRRQPPGTNLQPFGTHRQAIRHDARINAKFSIELITEIFYTDFGLMSRRTFY